jgi:hypothetical protein
MTYRKEQNNIDPILCRCGLEWGKHSSDWNLWGMKPKCVICGKDIGRYKNKEFIPNQCEARYKEKGNYCDKCNEKCNTTKSSHISFNKLFKLK